jgi:hypothetical protein
MNLNKFSTKNLERIHRVLKITLDSLELQGVNKLLDDNLKISLEKFFKEEICHDDIIAVFNQINKKGKIIWVQNTYIKKTYKNYREESSLEDKDIKAWNDGLLEIFGVSEEDLENYIVLKIKNLNKLKNIEQNVKKKLEKRAKKHTEIIKKQPTKIALYLNQDGDLYREPKKKYCYKIGKMSNRHRIIRFLVVNKGYQSTKLISFEANNKNVRTTRSEITKMRDNIEKYLKIDGRVLLQGQKGNGYRINPKYNIIPKYE